MAAKTTNSKPRAKPRETLPLMFTVPPQSKGLLSKKQVAALLSISESLLKQMIADGEYPHADKTLHSLPRWSVDTHNAWIDAHHSKPEKG